MIILRYIYRVKTCKLITLVPYPDSTYQLRSGETKHLPEKVYSSFFGRTTWRRTFTFTKLWHLKWVLPGFLGIRFLRSLNAAPDCRASRRLSITPVSSPSGGREKSELILWQLKLNYRKIRGKIPVRFT